MEGCYGSAPLALLPSWFLQLPQWVAHCQAQVPRPTLTQLEQGLASVPCHPWFIWLEQGFYTDHGPLMWFDSCIFHSPPAVLSRNWASPMPWFSNLSLWLGFCFGLRPKLIAPLTAPPWSLKFCPWAALGHLWVDLLSIVSAFSHF